MRRWRALLAALACGAAWGQEPLSGSRQAVVVITPEWGRAAGTLMRFERDGAQGGWRAVGESIPVQVGRKGMAWGVGLHSAQKGRQKREGDGKSPAGVFALTEVFGSALPRESFRLPYRRTTPTLQCVDDPGSMHYNTLVDRRVTLPDWFSAEEMVRMDGQYRWGAVVEHNGPVVRPGAGSCIFLHVSGEGTGTAGCTAMEEEPLLEVLRWLDGRSHPRLVQMPRREYGRLRAEWALPELPSP